MLTVTQLARQYSLSRTTILYYEREALLLPSSRSHNGYRLYNQAACERLEKIVAYRAFGLSIQEIAALLDDHDEKASEQALRKQFAQLDEQINSLRRQQSAIMALLQDPNLLSSEQLTKARWTEVMQAAGLSEQDMINWHKQFETMEPLGHQKFLESLNIDEQEVKEIRRWSRDKE